MNFIDFTPEKYQVEPYAPQHKMRLGAANRHCAIETCGRKLTRLNRDALCFRCQNEERNDRLNYATNVGLNKAGQLPARTGRIS